MASRKSDVPCPNGCSPLLQPVPENDWHTWDCYVCGLDLNKWIDIEARDVIEAYRDPEMRPLLLKLLPELSGSFGSIGSE